MSSPRAPRQNPAPPGVAKVERAVLPNIGEALRARRRLLQLSLAQVAQGSELSVGYISLLERNLASPSLTALMRIGEVLGLELDHFFHARSAGGHHFPRSSRTPFQLEAGGMTFDRISGDFPGSLINALLVSIPARHRSSPVTHAGEELVYLLSGNLRYTLGERTLHLSEGDSVHLPSATPHCWENPFAQAATVLWVGTAPLFKSGSARPEAEDELHRHGSPMQAPASPAHKADRSSPTPKSRSRKVQA